MYRRLCLRIAGQALRSTARPFGLMGTVTTVSAVHGLLLTFLSGGLFCRSP